MSLRKPRMSSFRLVPVPPSKILRNTPMERFGKLEELVGGFLFFVSDKASSFITGVVLPIDGGFSAYSGV